MAFSIQDAVRHGYSNEAPLCASCAVNMCRSELRAPLRRAVNRIGSPMPPVAVLPTWHCQRCGCHQPRLTA
jgi:hypothetical protein